MTSDRSIGWLEGIIDGEGCLMLNRRKYIGSKEFNYLAVLTVGSTTKCILERVQAIIGEGSIRLSSPSGTRLGKKPFFIYSLNPNGLRRFLPLARFVLKEPQRLLLLEALQITKRGQNQFGDRSRYARLKQIYEEIRRLNS